MADLLAGEILWRMAIPAPGGLKCLFIQDAPFVRDGDRYTAPFTCYPPFGGEVPFALSRSQLVLTAETARRLEATRSKHTALRRLGRAVRRKLSEDAQCKEVVIEPDDLVDVGPLRHPAVDPGAGSPVSQ